MHVAGPADVVRRDRPDRLLEVDAADGEVLDLVGVVVGVGSGLGEDRRVGGHADDVLVVDQLREVAGLQALPRDVVEPDGHALVGECLQSVVHVCVLS